MAILSKDAWGRRQIIVKGAPEVVLARCVSERGAVGRPLDAGAWRLRAEALAAQGQRLLAIAVKDIEPPQATLGFADVETGLVLLGLVGMIDPPRAEAIAAVRACQSAGIRVKMITGDHAATARAIAARLGLANQREVMTGQDLDRLARDELGAVASRIDVFARTSPIHKLRLVEALQAQGEVTAMTGDGVNDAPALKRSDIGVAMGKKGTEAAKEAAEIVLADDNFASIAAAVEEGRRVYDNIRKSLLFILPTSAAEALMIMVAVALGYVLPITPAQILWINMITAVTLGLALAFEPAEDDLMRRPPRRVGEALLSPLLLWRIGFVALLLIVGTFGLFVHATARGLGLEAARTIAVNMLVLFEVAYLVNCRRTVASVVSRDGLLGNRAILIAIAIVVALQLLFTYAATPSAPVRIGRALLVRVAVDGARGVDRVWRGRARESLATPPAVDPPLDIRREGAMRSGRAKELAHASRLIALAGGSRDGHSRRVQMSDGQIAQSGSRRSARWRAICTHASGVRSRLSRRRRARP